MPSIIELLVKLKTDDAKQQARALKQDINNLGAGATVAVKGDVTDVQNKIKGLGDVGATSGKTIGDGLANGATRARDEFGRFVKSAEQDLDKVGNKGGSMWQKIAQGSFAVNQVRESVSAVASGLDSFSNGYVALDTATAKIKTLGAESAKIAPDIKQAAIEMSTRLPFSAADIAGAMGDAMASGVQGGAKELSGFADTAAKLAVGGGAEIGAVVKGLGANLNAFGKSAEDSTKFADIMFNTVNAGVVSIDELNQYLSGVTPTAAAAGLGFENVGAAVALMTQKGVPAAQATTKLNAMLLELQKPGKELTGILATTGLTTEKLGKIMKEQGLPAALDEVSKAFEKSGKSATQAFSSSEAGAAFNILQGKAGQFSEFLDNVANTSGSTQFAYEQMADSIEVKQQQVNAQIDAFKNKALGAFPTASAYAINFAKGLGSIAPQVSAFASLTPIISGIGGGFLNLGKDLAAKFLPQLVTVSATGSISFASLGTVGTTAMNALKVAFATNPVGLIVTALIALGAAAVATYAILSKSTKEQAEDQLAQAEASRKNIESEIKHNDERKKSLNTTKGLVEEYKSLASKTNLTATEQQRLRTITQQLDRQYPSLIDQTKSFKDNLGGVAAVGATVNTELQKVTEKSSALQKQLSENTKAIATAKRNIAIGELQDTLGTLDWKFVVTMGIANKDEQTFRLAFQRLRAEFEKGLYTSKTIEDVDKAENKILEFINANAKALGDNEKELQIRDAIAKAVAAQKSALQAYGVVAKDEAKQDTAHTELKVANAKKVKDKKDDLLKDALKEIDEQRKQQENERKNATEILAKQQERAVTSAENLALEQKSIDAIREQVKLLEESAKKGKITVEFEPGKPVTVPITKDNKKDVTEFINNLNNNLVIASQNIKKTQIQVEIDAKVELRRKAELELKNLSADIEARIVPILPSRKKLLDLITSQIDDIEQRIKLSTDPKQTDELKAKLKELTKQFESQTTLLIRDEYVGGAKTAADAEYRQIVLLAQSAYQERRKLQGRTLDEESKDFTEYTQKRLEAERKLNEASYTQQQQLVRDFTANLAQQSQQAFAEAIGLSDEEKKSTDDRKKEYSKQETDLQKSYDRRLISQQQYYDKLRELEEKAAEDAKANADKQLSIWQVMAKGIAATFASMRDAQFKSIATSVSGINDYNDASRIFLKDRERAEAKLLTISDTSSQAYQDALKEKETAIDSFNRAQAKSVELTNTVYSQSLSAILLAGSEAIASGKNVMKAMVTTALDALQAMVPIWSAQIIGGSLATPTSILTFGASAIAEYTLLIGAMTLAVQGAKAAVAGLGFKRGGWTGDVSPDTPVGPAHGQEFYFPSDMARKDRPHFQRMLDERLTIEQYAAKYLPSKVAIEATESANIVIAKMKSDVSDTGIAAMTDSIVSKLDEVKKEQKRIADRYESHTKVKHQVELNVKSKDVVVW